MPPPNWSVAPAPTLSVPALSVPPPLRLSVPLCTVRLPEKTVFVKGDSRTTYGSVRDLMEAIHKANIDDVMLGTEDVTPTNK